MDDMNTEVLATTNEPSVVESTVSQEVKTEQAEPKAEKTDLRSVIASALEKQEKPTEDKTSALPKDTAKQAEPTKAVDPITGRVAEPMKAPSSWTPALREKWGSIDPQVQKFVLDRDRDMSIQLQQTAEARKFHKEFKELSGPMSDVLTKFGETPTQHAKQLFELSYVLNTGSPQQKAQVFFNLMNHFKPDAQTLQSLFSGQQVNVPPVPTPAPKAPDVDELVEQRLAERAAQEQEQSVSSEIEKFASNPANEFFNDVKASMGKIIEAGLVDTNKPYADQLAAAYEIATTRHPEISQILASRAPVQTTQPIQQTAPTPKAVQSVKPSLGAGKQQASAPRKMSAREAAERAWDSLNS